jgi:hypothetical protein
MENVKGSLVALAGAALLVTSLVSTAAHAGSEKAAKKAAVVDYWTPARRAAAQPRDLVIDHRGLGYLRRSDGSLQPYGHPLEAIEQGSRTPMAKPGSGDADTEAPVISDMDPAAGAQIGADYTLSAVVTDDIGLRSVSFIIRKNGGIAQSFTASSNGGDVFTVPLTGFSNGDWTWQVEAKDNAKRGGNITTSAEVSFTVDTSGGGGGGGGGGGEGVVTNSPWSGGDVQTAVGRLFYEMPSNPRRKRWAGYVCSGTVVTDPETDRSIILTASHCVYDDSSKAFARNVLFIPNQAETTGTRTDSNCDNDPLGCWVADFGVVDVNWTTRTFPDNIPWDYGFYVVDNDASSHSGPGDDVLESAAGALSIFFSQPAADDTANDGPGAPDYTHGMGYSYSDDPFFMYCAEDMNDLDSANWWLPSCDLSGGSSGGPWIQPLNETTGSGPIISVNSWGYTTSPGMAGPKLSGNSAECVFMEAKQSPLNTDFADGDAGVVKTCP